LNLARVPWEHPAGDGRSSRASYLDLVDEGVEAAALAIGALLEALYSGPAASLTEGGEASADDLGTSIVSVVGEGGLSVADRSGQPLAPRVSRPLPLYEIMEAEYLNRLDWARRSLGGGSN
jgi:hypothetical protein